MTKRKDAVALFDLINKSKAERAPGLSVPGWFSKRPAPAPTSEEAGASAEPPPVPEPSPFSAAAPSEPMVAVIDNQVRITLNYAGCVMAGVGLLLALGIFFWLGRISVRAPAVAAAGGGPNSGGVSPRPGDSGSAALAAPERVKGKWYLIIERTHGMTDEDKADANAIVDYCQRNGYPCNVARDVASHCWAVLSFKPFDSPTGQEALDFATLIQDLGGKYVPPRGRGKFSFSQKRGGRLDPSFYKWPG